MLEPVKGASCRVVPWSPRPRRPYGWIGGERDHGAARRQAFRQAGRRWHCLVDRRIRRILRCVCVRRDRDWPSRRRASRRRSAGDADKRGVARHGGGVDRRRLPAARLEPECQVGGWDPSSLSGAGLGRVDVRAAHRPLRVPFGRSGQRRPAADRGSSDPAHYRCLQERASWRSARRCA